MDSPAYDLVRVERFVPEPPEELLTEVVSEPRSPVPPAERAQFRKRYEMGPERFRQALLERWLAGLCSHFEAIRFLQRAEILKFSDLPLNHEEWEQWLTKYASR